MAHMRVWFNGVWHFVRDCKGLDKKNVLLWCGPVRPTAEVKLCNTGEDIEPLCPECQRMVEEDIIVIHRP